MTSKHWRPIVGWPGYEVSSSGRVYSLKTNRYLATGKDRDGYVTVQVTANRKSTVILVHRVTCRAFKGPRPSRRHEVRHLDGNIRNNESINLAWGTRKQNAADRERHGRTAHGERNGGGKKLTASDVRQIKALIGKETYVSLASSFGVCVAAIGFIKSGRLWRRV